MRGFSFFFFSSGCGVIMEVPCQSIQRHGQYRRPTSWCATRVACARAITPCWRQRLRTAGIVDCVCGLRAHRKRTEGGCKGAGSGAMQRRLRAREPASPFFAMLMVLSFCLLPVACDKMSTLKLSMARSYTWPTVNMWEPHLRPFGSLDEYSSCDLVESVASHPQSGGEVQRGKMKRTDPPLAGASTDSSTVKTTVSPLAESILLVKELERQHLMQAARCRSAARRMLLLERIATSRGQYQNNLLPPAIAREISAWHNCGIEMSQQTKLLQNGAAATMSRILDNAAIISGDLMMYQDKAASDLCLKSATDTGNVSASSSADLLGETEEPPKVRRVWKEPMKSSSRMHSHGIPAGDTPLPQHLEDKFRVGTWADIPIYGVCRGTNGNYEYAQGTEMHFIWDVDQTKLVGEGTNDVELVLKCLLWWKEECEHDPGFIPSQVDECIRGEFSSFCRKFNMSESLDRLMPYLARPGLKDFVFEHPAAKHWTFTNKDRTIDGNIVREVSDEDGLCGMYQDDVHEVSQRPVIDANKMALMLLDARADVYAGITNQERPLVGVRGEQKDLTRVARLLKSKWEHRKSGIKPVTLVLLDDKAKDGFGNCQTNEERCLVVLPPYDAITDAYAEEFIRIMEDILPLSTLGRFYRAFRNADSSHALVQCVEIMSDDHATLLQRSGVIWDPVFKWKPKLERPENQPPTLPRFIPVK